MRAQIKQNPDLLAVMVLVFATVILYSLWGGMVLRAGQHATNQTPLASR